MSKELIIRKPAKPTSQTNAKSSLYNRPLCVAYGVVDSNNPNGTSNIRLNSGFLVRLRIPSTTWTSKEPFSGGISYPPVGAEVMIYYPQDDINSGFIYPVNLNTRDADVEEQLLDQGDKKILPGGWEKTYDQEKGILTFKNGDLLLTIDPDAKKIDLLDFNANKIIVDDTGLLIEDLNGNTFKSNASAWEINGNSDNSVKYTALETAFNQLKSDLNALVTKYNTDMGLIAGGATAAVSAGGFWLTPLTIGGGQPSAADISGAKNDKIKV